MADPSGSTLQTDKTLEFSSGVQENNFLEPVPPFQSGEGLPYAPINWPNPGDTWGWKVGRRFNSSGYYTDRSLSLPRNLHKPNVPKQFPSKLAVERYIQSEFPDADTDAFWASFSWKVPALKNSTGVEAKPPSAVQATPASAEKVEEGKEENPVATNRKRKYTAAKTVANQRTRRSLRQAVPATKDTSGSNGNEEVTSNATRKDVNSTAEFQDDQPDNGSFEQSDSDCMPEDFNNYLDSLVGNLAYPATGNSLAQEHELGQNQVLNDKEKEKVIQQLQVEIDSNLSIVQEIDNQITQLHCRRGELIRKNENKKRLIAKIAIDDQKVR
ncbi:uncharacterized protein LOC123221885 [Mangifera indica]|uniref:uncharacterized protein LOC123221885 n=1 Tax=Mangifera indica TaxID=29780 RepID=UPI001CFA239B|nr:uncharacterized protein LOC123221885 [Mangifera indica]XP_044500792.1 uncharacterized protein LOC123221885 [Mangifera indica]